MNIKIKVDESSPSSVKATMYAADTNSNVGTLWMTREEFTQFVDTLTFGVSDGETLDVVDDYGVSEHYDDED